ncbi:restriction endonuclease subunit S [Thaumasiovibrio sp. DFM-14]|uniref:restriction endonuclease subunit S n=1 Tax=Thaumasiovibrio sp. DFM-14 TaxID=3384792 RepID=UPI0039A1B123
MWVSQRLSEITSKIGSGATPRGGKAAYKEEGMSLIRSMNVHDRQFRSKDLALIDDQQAEKLKNVELYSGDVLLNITGASVARCCVVPDDFLPARVNQHVSIIRVDQDVIDPDFLCLLLTSKVYKDRLLEVGEAGATREAITKTQLQNFEIAFPSSLREQREVVANLDAMFADIDKAKQNAEQNLKNARELFDSYLQNVLSQKGEGWQETTVGNEIELLTGNAFKSKDYVSDADSVKLLRGDNIMQGYFRWDGAKFWPNSRVNEFEKFLLKEGDIVLAMDRTWVKAGMKFAQITANELPCLLLQRVARLRCKQGMNKDLLYFLMGSKLFESYVLSIQTGLGVPHISGKQIQSFTFNKPSLEEQGVIADKLKTLSTEIDKLKSIYAQKVENLNELKQSILQKAFNGEL